MIMLGFNDDLRTNCQSGNKRTLKRWLHSLTNTLNSEKGQTIVQNIRTLRQQRKFARIDVQNYREMGDETYVALIGNCLGGSMRLSCVGLPVSAVLPFGLIGIIGVVNIS